MVDLSRMPVTMGPPRSFGPVSERLSEFGKHMGSTFLEVYEQDREYCLWILETVEKGDPSAEIHQFAQYLQNKLLEETYERDSYHMEMDSEL